MLHILFQQFDCIVNVITGVLGGLNILLYAAEARWRIAVLKEWCIKSA